jgi:hypothetical protein
MDLIRVILLCAEQSGDYSNLSGTPEPTKMVMS